MLAVPLRVVDPAGAATGRCAIVAPCETRRAIVITKRGKPVARLVPVEEKRPGREIFGCMKGTVTILGDVVGPVCEPDVRLANRGILYGGEDEDRRR